MKKFIFLTFGFMGWAFYEMSGGADFDPEAQRMARLEAAETTDTTGLVTAALANAARQLDQRDTVYPAPKTAAASERNRPEPTRVALNLTTLSDLPRPGDVTMVQKAVATAPERQPMPTPAVLKAGEPASNSTGAKVIKASATTGFVPRTAGMTTSSADTPAIIPSLIDPNDTNIQQIDASQTGTTRVSTSQSDIRVVSGNRVNVRGGPGTNFGVVGKLGAGDTVEVIEDNGAGWVRFRSVNGQETGWMADFLLSSG